MNNFPSPSPCISRMVHLMKTPWLFSSIVSLLFSSLCSWNLAFRGTIDPLIFDNQVYANLAYNFALGRGFSLVNTGDCWWELLTPKELREAVVRHEDPVIPNNIRSPGHTVWLGAFLWCAQLDLKRAVLLHNFFGLWATGFFLCMIMHAVFRRLWTGALALAIHFAMLPFGWSTVYPVLPVNLFLLAHIFFFYTWIVRRKRGDLVISGTFLALLIVTRYHWILFLPCMLMVLMVLSRQKFLSFIKSTALIFAAPALILCSAWTVRNGVVLHDWSFEGRGVIHLFIRVYPDGWGSFIYPEPRTFPGIIESIIGPLPEKAKKPEMFHSFCTPRHYPDFPEIPPHLRSYTLLASCVLIAKHPLRYIASAWWRAKEMFTTNRSPDYWPRRSLFMWPPLQKTLSAFHITDAVLLFMYPLTWYVHLFGIVLAASIVGMVLRKRVHPLLLLALMATCYNIFVNIFLGDNMGNYSNFSWAATLIVIASAYGVALHALGIAAIYGIGYVTTRVGGR
jgi:hypothetical protein